MAILDATTLMDLDWRSEDRLELIVGSEGAPNLIGSTPAGGGVFVSQSPLTGNQALGGLGADPLGESPLGETSIGLGLGEGELGLGVLGVNDLTRPRLTARYSPLDKCAYIPVGLRTRDASGNLGNVTQTIVQLSDTPDAPRNVAVVDIEQSGQLRLTWDESPDV